MRNAEGAALIGHTGFVGGNLVRQMRFDDRFRSSDIERIAGRSFDFVVCAGVSAVKWLANREPENDRAGIARLVDVLRTVSARRFVLISTVDVYPEPQLVDEASVIPRSALTPYGRHRLELEDFVRERFTQATILRLPALFGPGLKKNVIYDLMHANQLEKINPASLFQWYPLERLGRDIDNALAAGLDVVNLVTEPVATSQLLPYFPPRVVGGDPYPLASYDIRTRHAFAFGGEGEYVMTADQVVAAVATFLAEEPGA